MATSAAEVINLPQDVLENTPAAPPPTAADSVFIRHNTKTAAEVAVASVFLALASIFFLTRIYTKFFIIRKPGWDDCKTPDPDLSSTVKTYMRHSDVLPGTCMLKV